jgi:demethylmenaquinone methyltransferase/2-methoxy-6-polyprenyl-1,4-benzoquinol methylase
MQEYRYTARIYDPLLSSAVRPIRSRIISLIKRYGYHSILDVCCGTGEQLKLLKEHGIDGEGIDLSDAMLKVAQKGEYRADCKNQDASQMEYEEGAFDLAMTTFALHEKSPETARAIVEEMLRVTARGGDVLIVDYELSEKTSPLYKMLVYIVEWIAGGEHYRNFRSYIAAGGLPALLDGTSLTEIKRYYFARHSIVLLLLRKQSDTRS